MVTLHQQSSTDDELERILATFHASRAMCKAALLTLLYALATLLLALVHAATFVINLAIGVLMCAHAVVCMARLLLVLVQERAANPLNTVERRY